MGRMGIPWDVQLQPDVTQMGVSGIVVDQMTTIVRMMMLRQRMGDPISKKKMDVNDGST